VQVRVYAGRIVIVREARLVGEHEGDFGRDKTIFDPWHYIPALELKPGALGNGAALKDWDLPKAMERVHNGLNVLRTETVSL